MAVSAPPQETQRGIPTVVLAIIGLALLVAGLFFPVALAPVEIKASTLFTINGFPISNSLITGWLSILILVILFALGTRAMRLLPTRRHNVAGSGIGGVARLAWDAPG